MSKFRIWSASQLETAGRCERLWALRYLDNIKVEVESGGARALGSEIHEAHEDYELGRQVDWEGKPGQVLQSMLTYLGPEWTGGNRPGGVEVCAVLRVDGHYLQVLVDMVTTHGVCDLKTTSNLAYALLPRDIADMYHPGDRQALADNLQACLYALWFCTRFNVDRALCLWVYGETKERRVAAPCQAWVTRDHALAVVRKALQAADRMLALNSSSEAKMNPAACNMYGGCDYLMSGDCVPPLGKVIAAQVMDTIAYRERMDRRPHRPADTLKLMRAKEPLWKQTT